MLRRANEVCYRIERWLVGVALVIMGLVVFLDVVHRVTTREDGFTEQKLASLVGVELADTLLPYVVGLAFAGFMYTAFRWRGAPSWKHAFVYSVLTTVGLYGLLEFYVWLVPNGLVWSQYLALALMIWAGLVGSSLAAKERRHLSLEVGPRLFPVAMRPYVIALGHLVTAAFTLWLCYLGVWSVQKHYALWDESGHEAGIFTALIFDTIPLPKWIAFIAIPYGLLIMSLRFLGDAVAAVKGEETSADELENLKKLGGIADGEAKS